MKKTWLRLGIILLLTVVFLYFFFRSVDWKEVGRYLAEVNVIIFILTVFIVPLHLVTRSLRWRVLLVHEKKSAKFSSMFISNAIGFGVTFIFPARLGELVRPLYLAQKERIRKGFALGTIVVERTFDLFTMCFLLGVFLLAQPLFVSLFKVNAEAYEHLRFWGIIGVAFTFLLLFVSLSLYFFREKTLAVISFFMKPLPERFSRKVLELSQDFIEGLKFFHSFKTFLLYTLLSFVVWLGIVFYYWVFFSAFGISLPFFLVFPYVFLTMVGASVPTPGMVGGFHYFSKLGLTTLYGTDPNLAIGVSILVHAEQILVTGLIGYAILWKEGMSLFQLKKLGKDEGK